MNTDEIKLLQDEFLRLRQEIDSLSSDYYKNNFTSGQDFNKYSRFNSRLKVPSFSTLPSTCEVGEIGQSSGKLYICSAANTWTVVGTQT